MPTVKPKKSISPQYPTEVKNIESSENQICTELIQKIQHMSHEQLIKVVDFVGEFDV